MMAVNRAIEQSASRLMQCFEIAAAIGKAVSTESLQRACVRATRELDFDFYLFGGYYPVVEGLVVSSNYPPDWRVRYDSNNYVAIDPVVRHCWSESSPLLWDRIEYAEGKQGQKERRLMQEACEFGLRSGISIPVHGAGAEGCMLSLASKREAVRMGPQDEAGLQLIVHAIHDVTKRLVSRTVEGRRRAHTENLSPREIECLSWTARGKTSWAITRILDVSENTVTFHLRNAIRKLEVTNRSQAVAKAIALSKITPF